MRTVLIALVVVVCGMQAFLWLHRPAVPAMARGAGDAAVPESAPAFSLHQAADGATLSLDDMLAKGPVLVVFYKAECPTTVRALPLYEFFQNWYAAKGNLQVVGVAQNDVGRIQAFSRAMGVTFPQVEDPPPYAVSRSYGIQHTPTLVLVGQDHRTLGVVQGWNRERLNALSQQIASLTGAEYKAASTLDDHMPAFQPG